MLRSMTAFARVQETCDAGVLTWEVRSVNHRYLEFGIKLPEDFKQLEPDVRKLAAKYLKRGKVDIGLRYEPGGPGLGAINLNNDLLRQLRNVEQAVLDVVHEGQKLSVSDILGWPGVITNQPKDLSQLITPALNSLQKALGQLVETRETEGRALRQTLTSRCAQISDIVKQLRVHHPAMVSAMREKWKTSLNDKFPQWRESVNQDRLEQELALLAQKLDVDEELDRLDSHITEVNSVLERKEAVGRRLDFLMQELNREASTLSSKSQDSLTTQHAVELKVLIEQMREQVQNIE